MDHVTVHRIGHTPTISSLALGTPKGGVAWRSGRNTVALHPLNAFPRTSEATLYYQLSGLVAGSPYRTTIELIEGRRADAKPALSMSFEETPDGQDVEVIKSIGLREVDPGIYRLRVTVTTAAGDRVTQESLLTVVD
jgi:hypothetical protein